MAETTLSVTELKKIWTTKKQEDDTLIITSYKGNDIDVIIPSEIGKNIVSALGEETFSITAPRLNEDQKKARKAIKSLTVPGTIKVIPQNLFYCAPFEGNMSIEKVVFEEGVEEIKNNAFQRCVNLKEVVLPKSLKKIVGGAFGCCEALENIEIPDSIEEIGSFQGCTKLSSIDLPKSITEIPPYFYAKTRIAKCVIPDHITKIGRNAFDGCKELKEVSIPSGCTEIGEYCFNDCSELMAPNMPDGITIGNGAFQGCSKMTDENGFITVGGKFYGYVPTDENAPVEIPENIQDFPTDMLREYKVIYTKKSASHKAIPDLSRAKVGDDVTFGMFPIDESMNMQPLSWKVIKIDGNKALMITNSSIMALDRMSTQKRTWEESKARELLNGAFLAGAFSDDERKIIVESKLKNHDSRKWKTPGGNDTEDKVFLLSMEEIEEVFKKKEDRISEITAYAKLQAFVKREGVSFWDTRTPGKAGWGPAAISNYDGEVDTEGNHIGYDGIRPAIWVIIDS